MSVSEHDEGRHWSGIRRAALRRAASSAGVQAQSAHPRGYLFIVGGGPQPPELVQRFVDLAGGKKAKIVVFAMASSDGKQSGEEKADDLRKLGADAHAYYINQDEANSDSMVKNMQGVTGVWFGGGDQVLLTKALLGTQRREGDSRSLRARARWWAERRRVRP